MPYICLKIGEFSMFKSVHFHPLAALVAAFFWSLIATTTHAAPSAELIPKWQAHNPASQTVIDHSPLDNFLKTYRYVGEDGVARIRYNRVHQSDKMALIAYVTTLERVRVSDLNRDEQYAYWVNLYNAETLKIILDHYPVQSIRDINISPGFFSSGPWGKTFLKVEGSELSLDNIEHGILRPIWQDPRTHYVVNCASIGCPDIPERALTAANKDEMHEDAARAFINHRRGVRVSDQGDVYASSIYDWFGADFGRNDGEILDHMRQYANPELLQKLSGKTDIEGFSYSWDLNGVPDPNE